MIATHGHVTQRDMLLAGMTDQERSTIFAALRRVALGPRQCLFRQGEPSLDLFIVEQGLVRVFFVNDSGQQHTNEIGGPGMIVGGVELLLHTAHFLCAESIGQATVGALSRAQFRRLAEAIPRLGPNLHTVLVLCAKESALRNSRVMDSAAVKLGKTLCDLARGIGARVGESSYAIRGITIEDIAMMVGASRTWTSLTIGAFERHGVVTRDKKGLLIADVQLLTRYIATLPRSAARAGSRPADRRASRVVADACEASECEPPALSFDELLDP
jgi:CRP-like cAMP-binding protein